MVAQTSTLRIVVDSSNAKRNAEDFDKTLKSIEKDGISASKSMEGMSSSVKSLAGYMVGLASVSKAIAMADGYTQMAARIKNATSSAQEYAMVQDRILETANGTFRSLSEAQEVYLSLAGGMKSLGKTTADTLDVADSLSYAFVANAARADQAQSAMDALNKSMARGKVDSDAWISIVSAADNIIADMAKQTGKTEAQIRQLGVTGKISLTELLDTLKATRLENKALADNMENSFADGMQKLTNSITVYLGKANESTSATGQMAAALGALADNIDVVFGAAFVAAVGLGTKALVTKGIAVKAAIVDSNLLRQATIAEQQSQLQALGTEALRQKQLTALAMTEIHLARVELNSALTREQRAAATMRLTQAEVAYNIASRSSAASTLAYTTATNAATVSTTALARAKAASMALLGGPVGLGLLVAGVAASYLLMSNNASENTKSLRENNESVKDAVKNYRELDSIQRSSQLVAEKKKLEELTAERDKATRALMFYATGMDNANDFVTQSQIELEKLFNEYKKTGDLKAFNAEVQNSSVINQNAKDKVAILGNEVQTAGGKYREQKQFVDAASNSMDNNAVSANNAANANRNAANAVAEYTEKLKNQKWDLEFTNALIDKGGFSARKADLTLQAYRENEKKGIKGLLPEQRKLIAGIEQEEKIAARRLESQRAAVSGQKKAASESAKASKQQATQAKKDAKDLEQLAKEQFDARESIYYEFATQAMRIEKDLQNKIAEIRGAGFSSADESGYIQNAKNRADYESQLYKEQLAEDLNSWKENEAEKLDRKVRINELIIKLNSEMDDDMKQQAIASLRDQSNYELDVIEANSQKRLLTAEQDFITKKDYIERLGQIERDEIALNMSYTEEEKKRLTALQKRSQGKKVIDAQDEDSAPLRGITNDIQSTGEFAALEQQLIDRQKIIDKALEVGLINEQDAKNRSLAIEQDYQRAKADLTLGSTEAVFGSLASMFDKDDERQKKYYKAMIILEKTTAIARASLAISSGMGQALNAPFPANLVAMAGVAAQGASIISSIRSITTDGFADGGYTGNGGKYDVAGLVHKGEVVFSQQDIARNGGVNAVESIRTSGQQQQQAAPVASPIEQTIVNYIDPNIFNQFLKSDAGQRALINTITDNATQVRRVVG